MVATLSGLGAAVPLPGVSFAVDMTLLANELKLYKTQLGLPDEHSDEFERMTPEWRGRATNYLIPTLANMGSMLATYAACVSLEEYSRFIPILGMAIASSLSFATTYSFLKECLSEMEEIALEFLDAMTDLEDD